MAGMPLSFTDQGGTPELGLLSSLSCCRPSDPQPPLSLPGSSPTLTRKPGAVGHRIRGRIHWILHNHDKEVRIWGRHLAETPWPPGPSRANVTWIHRRVVIWAAVALELAWRRLALKRGRKERGMRRSARVRPIVGSQYPAGGLCKKR
jgi:hypothetical protein